MASGNLDVCAYFDANGTDNVDVRYFTTHPSKGGVGNLHSSLLSCDVDRQIDTTTGKRINVWKMCGFQIRCSCSDIRVPQRVYRTVASILTLLDEPVERLLNNDDLPIYFEDMSNPNNLAFCGYLFGCALPTVPMFYGSRIYAFFTKNPGQRLERAEQLSDPTLTDGYVADCSICTLGAQCRLGLTKIGANGSHFYVTSYIFAQPDPRRPNANLVKNQYKATRKNGEDGVYVYHKNEMIFTPEYLDCTDSLRNMCYYRYSSHMMRFKTFTSICASALTDGVTYILASEENPNPPAAQGKRNGMNRAMLENQAAATTRQIRFGNLDSYFSKTATYGRSDGEEQCSQQDGTHFGATSGSDSWLGCVTGYIPSHRKINRLTYVNDSSFNALMQQFLVHKLAPKRSNNQRTHYIGKYGTDDGFLGGIYATDSCNVGQNFMLTLGAMFCSSRIGSDDELVQLFERAMRAHEFRSTGLVWVLFADMHTFPSVEISTDPTHLGTCAVFLTSMGYGPVDVLRLSDNIIYLTAFNSGLVSEIVGSVGMYITPMTALTLKLANSRPALRYLSLLAEIVPMVTHAPCMPKISQGASNTRNTVTTYAANVGCSGVGAEALPTPEKPLRSALHSDRIRGCLIKNVSCGLIEDCTDILDTSVSEDSLCISDKDAEKFASIEYLWHSVEVTGVRKLRRPKDKDSEVFAHDLSCATSMFTLPANKLGIKGTVAVNNFILPRQTVASLSGISSVVALKSKLLRVSMSPKSNTCNLIYVNDAHEEYEHVIRFQRDSLKTIHLGNGNFVLAFATSLVSPLYCGDKLCSPYGQKVTVRKAAHTYLGATSVKRADIGERLYGQAARLERLGRLPRNFCSTFFGDVWFYMPPKHRHDVVTFLLKRVHADGNPMVRDMYFFHLTIKAKDAKSVYQYGLVQRDPYTGQLNKGRSQSGSSNTPRSEIATIIAAGAVGVANMLLERSVGGPNNRSVDSDNLTVVPRNCQELLHTLRNLGVDTEIEYGNVMEERMNKVFE